MYGFSAHQGFYVYRGDRLLLSGDWLGLLRKEESYKLVRIQINLPNSVDSDWQIDIKKFKSIPTCWVPSTIGSICKESLRNRIGSI